MQWRLSHRFSAVVYNFFIHKYIQIEHVDLDRCVVRIQLQAIIQVKKFCVRSILRSVAAGLEASASKGLAGGNLSKTAGNRYFVK